MDRTFTLQSIADVAGLSRATVSMAMRNHPALKSTTRERIQKIAAEIGYRPNPMVSALMAQLKATRPQAKRRTIAFLTSHNTRGGWRRSRILLDYYKGAAQQAAKMGYHLEDFWLKRPCMTAAGMTPLLEARGVVGVIVAPLPAGSNDCPEFDVTRFASAVLGHSLAHPVLHRAANHDFGMVHLAMHELGRRGYRGLALALRRAQDREVGYHLSAGYHAFQQTLPTGEQLPVCYLDGMSPRVLRTWIKRHRPQAMILGSPRDLALFKKTGIRVPEEMGVVLVDTSSQVEEKAATLKVQNAVTGAAAVDLIVGQIHRNERGIPQNAKTTLTAAIWQDGDTVRKVDQVAAMNTR